jgi:RimJ/RimL family protein N-acetyltransferase
MRIENVLLMQLNKAGNLKFRLLAHEDLPFFNRVRNEASPWLHNNSVFTLDQTQEWFETLPPDQKYYIIEWSNPSHCGLIEQIGYFRVEESKESIKIGADLDTPYQGFGLAFEAYKEFIDQSRYSTFWLEVLGFNSRAYNLYRKLGFTPFSVIDFKRKGEKHCIPSIQMVFSKNA